MKKVLISIFLCVLSISVFAQSVIVLKDNASLRTDNGKGGTVYAMEILSGIKMELLSPAPVKKDLVTSKEITPDISFYHVRYQGKEYYIRESEATIGSTVGVIIENSVLFTYPTLDSFRNAYLEPGTIISCGKTVESKGLSFMEIEFYDTTAWTKRTRYILKEGYSTNSADIDAIQLVQKVLTLSDKNLQKQLLDDAMSLNVCTEVLNIIKETEQEIFGPSFTENDIVVLDSPLEGYAVTADAARINVRSFPGIGEVVGQIETNTPILVVGKTTKTQTIEGLTAEWYKITVMDDTQLNGWIFGGYFIAK
ncbi:MAG: SH3 domain-containing protein [Treponema sp.]|nr:SH3 domain-containing protein [Treponema sp.]MBP3607914.1 SH3 domain-containing protein [Treponema sp.]